jgi:hypothetical protein
MSAEGQFMENGHHHKESEPQINAEKIAALCIQKKDPTSNPTK